MDNSFFDPANHTISFGSGGVDDAEDADIINHEYAHALHADVIPFFGASEDARAIGEGLADYWAVTMSQPINHGYDVPCIGDWDATGFGASCLIRTDSDITTADRNGEPHHDGQIISRALWDVNQAIGRDAATTIMLESLFALAPDVTFVEAAAAMIDTANRLFGRPAARVVSDAFAQRGIATRPRPSHPPRVPEGGAPGFREIARLFAPAPGNIAYENQFEPYALNDQGHALFASDISTGGQAVFLSDGSGVSLVARSGDPAPGGGVLGLGVLQGPGLSAQGDVAFSYVLAPFLQPFGLNSGVYHWSRGTLMPVVVPGETTSPEGSAFVGASEKVALNSAGMIAFSGMVPTSQGISGDLGLGVYVYSAVSGLISTVAAPGARAQDGGTFDYAAEPTMNEAGDVAFTGHLAGRPCLTNLPQTVAIGCVRDLFVRDAGAAAARRVIGVGDAAPGGGVFRDIRYPVVNGGGDILFRAVILPKAGPLETGYFLSRAGQIVPVARVGDAMPGGGAFRTAAFQVGNWDLSDRGDVTFSATLNTVSEETGFAEQGLYRWSNGKRSLITRTGAPLPAGVVLALQPVGLLGIAAPFSGAGTNNSGEIMFQATVIPPEGFLETVLYVRK
jgi:hypothetical protein